MWEKDVNINEVKEILCKSNVYFGVGAIEKIDDIVQKLKEKDIKKVIVISGKGAYKITGAWDYVEKALIKHNVSYTNYAKCSPNPTTTQIDEATKQAVEFGAQAVIGIGGGSAIDTAKSTAILIKNQDYNADNLYEGTFTPNSAVPIVAINLTHGTGTEANRFAVATITSKDYKPAIAYDCIYPMYSIDDPNLTVKLSSDQTRYVSIDAINHVIEAATSKVASPFAITLAKETIELVKKYLPAALDNPSDLEARYYLLYASLLGGICFDNGLLHYTHALEHPLSALQHDLSHGLGLAMLLPSVIKNIYPAKSNVLAYILSPIAPGLKGTPDEAQIAGDKVYEWLKSVGVGEKLKDKGFMDNDVQKLTYLAFNTPSLGGLLAIAPTEANETSVMEIYKTSL